MKFASGEKKFLALVGSDLAEVSHQASDFGKVDLHPLLGGRRFIEAIEESFSFRSELWGLFKIAPNLEETSEAKARFKGAGVLWLPA